MNRGPQVLFGILICLAVVVVTFWAIGGVKEDQGFDHLEYPKNTMQQAPDRGERNRWVTISASCFGALTCLFVVGGLALGLSRQQQTGFAAWILALAAVIFASLFLLVVFLYSEGGSSAARIGGLPVSTAVMVVVFAPSPLVLVVLYMVAFPRWILSPAEEARFHELVTNRQAEQKK